MTFIYAGCNDNADKKSTLMLLDDFKKFADLVYEKLMSVQLFLSQ